MLFLADIDDVMLRHGHSHCLRQCVHWLNCWFLAFASDLYDYFFFSVRLSFFANPWSTPALYPSHPFSRCLPHARYKIQYPARPWKYSIYIQHSCDTSKLYLIKHICCDIFFIKCINLFHTVFYTWTIPLAALPTLRGIPDAL